jgi:Ca2+-binding EF-hand superfamily protein
LSCVADVSNKADNYEMMQQCFSVFDKENTGVIKTDEFRHVLKAIGDPLTDEEVRIIGLELEIKVNSVLKELDIYGDGNIRMKDLLRILSFKAM